MIRRLYTWGAALLSFAASLIWLRWDAKRDERRDRQLQDAKDALATRKRIDHADVGNGDATADRDWLRDRGKR